MPLGILYHCVVFILFFVSFFSLVGVIISSVSGLLIAANSSGGKTDIVACVIYGTTGGAIGGLVGDIVTGNSMAGIITGATIGTGVGVSMLILKELSTIG